MRQSRLIMAAAALILAAEACGPLAAGTPATFEPAAPSDTPTPSSMPEIISPTALPVLPSPTVAAETATPEVTPTLTAAPSPKSACSPPQVDPGLMGSLKWVAYCDTRNGFGFRYPTTGGDSYAGNGRIYLPYLLGTNLHEKFLDVTVTEGAATCSSPASAGYAPGTVPTENLTFNGIPFVKESGSDAGAGNYYEWTGYSTQRGSQCISLTFTLHWVNRLNYDTPPPEFDEAAETAFFPTIMSTFSWLTP